MIFTPKQQRKNVETLARFIGHRVPARRFVMDKFSGRKRGCGSIGCALGWSPYCPTLQNRGLGNQFTRGFGFSPTINGQSYSEVDFAETVFGDEAYDNLFSSALPITTPTQWARHARKWLKETA